MTATRKRHNNDGVRKVCGCPRRRWLKCPHPWHVNFKLKGGDPLRKSVDKLAGQLDQTLAGKHIASKEDAKKILDKLRTDLREGRLVIVTMNGRVDVAPPTAPVVDTLTVEQLLEQFITRHVALSARARSLENARCAQRVIERTELQLPTGERRRFGDWLVRDVTSDAIDKFKAVRKAQTSITAKDAEGVERTRRVGGVIGTNRNLSFLRAAFNWGLKIRMLDFLAESPFRHKGRSRSRFMTSPSDDAVGGSKATKPSDCSPRAIRRGAIRRLRKS